VVVKHHDGYDLWPSRLTTWSAPRDHDLLATLAPAARRAHLRLFLYYSLLDLHEPTYRRDMGAYLAFVRAQLRELLTSYGPIAGIWFDGTWDRAISDPQLESLYALIHRLQPWALVTTNHHRAPLPGEDFQVFEAGFPGRPAPAWAAAPVSKLAHQAAITLGPTWFWSGRDAPLSSARFEHLLAEARATHTSLLANVPPRPDGSIGADVLAALKRR
jgi:alpha-L-fucosidase